jgi:hypothetical protein
VRHSLTSFTREFMNRLAMLTWPSIRFNTFIELIITIRAATYATALKLIALQVRHHHYGVERRNGRHNRGRLLRSGSRVVLFMASAFVLSNSFSPR